MLYRPGLATTLLLLPPLDPPTLVHFSIWVLAAADFIEDGHVYSRSSPACIDATLCSQPRRRCLSKLRWFMVKILLMFYVV